MDWLELMEGDYDSFDPVEALSLIDQILLKELEDEGVDNSTDVTA
jgi:hypothetical protein